MKSQQTLEWGKSTDVICSGFSEPYAYEEFKMSKFMQRIIVVTCFFPLLSLLAADRSAFAKEKQIPQTAEKSSKQSSELVGSEFSNFKPFTGKILGNGVRMRLSPDVESPVIQEIYKGELVVVSGEKNDFYAIDAPADLKVFIFRSFVLDNIVEGNRVNVRLSPELNAPVVGYMNTGDRVEGTISDKNHKWLEIAPPKNVRFFIAREYIDKIGGPDLKVERDKKKNNVAQLMDAADLLSQSEMMKPFQEIDYERISESYNTVIRDYADFPAQADKAKAKLMEVQEAYLQKKLAYLESKASRMSREMAAHGIESSSTPTSVEHTEATMSPKERMKIWERVEESHFLAWAASHHQKTIEDFYEDQKMASVRITGIVECYTDLVKNKPGNYIVRDRDMPRAYLYSTFVNLQNYVGKYVTLVATPRPNNNFAFPAYFILEVEQ